jgi:hypothetical protein
LDAFNNAAIGKAANFFSPAFFLNPDWKGALVEDIGGTSSKVVAYEFLRGVQNSPSLYSYDAQIAADLMQTVAKRIPFVLAAAAIVQSYAQVYYDLQ